MAPQFVQSRELVVQSEFDLLHQFLLAFDPAFDLHLVQCCLLLWRERWVIEIWITVLRAFEIVAHVGEPDLRHLGYDLLLRDPKFGGSVFDLNL